MMKKIIFICTVIFMTLLISVNSLCVTNFATDFDNLEYQILAKKYNELEKASFNTYDYKFVYKDYGDYQSPSFGKLDFENGVLGGTIEDFDNDNQYELLVFESKCNVRSTDTYPDEITNSVEAYIYEVENNEAKLVDNTTEVYGTLYGSSGGTECFIKTVGDKKYIVMQNTYQDNVFSDGAYYTIKIFEYGEKGINQLLEFAGAGSFVHVQETEIVDFKKYGFNKIYNYFHEDNMTGGNEYAFSPYFDSFNIANIEDNVEKVVEILITNNADKYSNYNIDFDLYTKNIIDKATISVKINNFTSIKAAPDIKVILNGEELFFEQSPYIENGTTMVPMRAIFTALGASVDYDEETKTITSVKGSTVIKLTIGSTTATINGQPKALSVAPTIKNGYTMVPLRFISEALGADVSWNDEIKQAAINDTAQLKVLTSSGSLNFREGDEFTIAVSLNNGDTSETGLSEITLAMDNYKLIEPIDTYYKDGWKCFKMKAVYEGNTYIYPTNEFTGERKSIPLVINRANVYTTDAVPTVNSFVFDSNFYDFSGMTIDSYTSEKQSNGSCNVSFDVYNSAYIYGVVEVYNSKDELKSAVPINKYQNIQTSIKGTAQSIADLWTDICEKRVLTLRQASDSKYTHIDVTIPKGGYIVITNDVNESVFAGIYNVLDLGFQIKSFSGAMKSISSKSDDFMKELTTKVIKDKIALYAAENKDKFTKKISEGIGKKILFSSEGLSNVSDICESLENIISEMDINELVTETLTNMGFSASESIFKELAGPAGGRT